ncbi:mRNA surveillance protein pelota [Candidatus Woesearchaeota archaeon]|nr:mRNA surveillance protein pelota [Candidatus Woesearchaeota archaeon]
MKILEKNLRQGEVKVLVESPEDVWFLSQLIDSGDIIKGKTFRKMKVSEEADATKRAVFMAVRAEKVEYLPGMLRINGKVVDGPEDVARGSYHTFAVEQGLSFSIVKEHWLGFQLDRLQEAAEQRKAKILICVFDREEAFFALLKASGVELLSHIQGDVERKRVQTSSKVNFFEQVVKQIQDYDVRFECDAVVVASPAFWKEELLKVVKDDKLRRKLVLASCSSVDEGAIDEVLKRDEVRSALRQERTSREMLLVDQVLGEIAKKGPVVYGLKQTETAASAGAISTLLVTDSLISKLRERNEFAQVDAIMRLVDRQKGKVVIVSHEHAGGKRLDGLGGIAALLRYRLE